MNGCVLLANGKGVFIALSEQIKQGVHVLNTFAIDPLPNILDAFNY